MRNIRWIGWTNSLLLLIGILLVLLGGWDLIGERSAFSVWPPFPFPLRRTEYVSGAAFAFCGAAAVLLALGFEILARFLLAPVVLVGALSLYQYLASIYRSVIPSLGRILPAGYLDIGPLTGSMFVCGGFALLFLKKAPPYTTVRSVFAALLASAVVALGLLQLFGAWSGNRFVYDWLRLTGGEGVDALRFVLLGAGLLVFIFFDRTSQETAVRKWAPIPAWFSVFVGTLVLWQANIAQESRQIQANTDVAATQIRALIENDLQTQVLMLERLAARWGSYTTPNERWEQDTRELLREPHQFQAVAWADKDLVVRWVYPPEGNAVSVGDYLLAQSQQRAAAEAALKNRAVTITKLMTLHNGAKGFHAYAPIYARGTFLGMAVGVVKAANWLQSVVGGRYTDYTIALVEGDVIIDRARAQDDEWGRKWRAELPIWLYGGTWKMQVSPLPGALSETNFLLPQATLGAGVILATLFALSIFLFQTARRRAQDLETASRQTERSRDFYFRLFSDFPNLVWRTDPTGTFDYHNQAWLDFTGRRKEEELGDGWIEGLHPDDRESWSRVFSEALRRQQPFEIEYRLRRTDETYGWIICVGRPYYDMDGKFAGYIGSCYDNSGRRAAQVELQRSQEHLRALSQHLQTIREEEKARIAREIHDELGAILTALKMDVSWMARKIPAEQNPLLTKTHSMARLVDSAVQVTRKISTELRPTILDDLGWIAALRWQAAEYQKRMGTPVIVDVQDEHISVDKERAIVLFRIFQETLTNVARHAGAKTVRVRFSHTREDYILEITDDGVGISEEQIVKPTSHGIRGMLERVQPFHGRLTVTRAPVAGTTVHVSIPKPVEAETPTGREAHA